MGVVVGRGTIVGSGVVYRMLRTVVLEHKTADGSTHFDWMIEDPTLSGERRLATWRTRTRPDRAAPGEAFTGERIGAHRGAYLEYQGPLGGDRGSVRRVAQGSAEWVGHPGRAIVILVRWSDGRQSRFEGHGGDTGGWSWVHDPA